MHAVLSIAWAARGVREVTLKEPLSALKDVVFRSVHIRRVP